MLRVDSMAGLARNDPTASRQRRRGRTNGSRQTTLLSRPPLSNGVACLPRSAGSSGSKVGWNGYKYQLQRASYVEYPLLLYPCHEWPPWHASVGSCIRTVPNYQYLILLVNQTRLRTKSPVGCERSGPSQSNVPEWRSGGGGRGGGRTEKRPSGRSQAGQSVVV